MPKLFNNIQNRKLNNVYIIYNYWRFRIFYSIFFGYIFFYFTRKSFIFVSPLVINELNLSLKEIGFISTIFYITYAISKFIGGIISDKSNPRYLMSFGLILTGICNICIGLASNIYIIITFWTINALFQGFGWPPVTKQLTHWYSKMERGLWWGICSTSHNIGGAIIPIIVGYLSIHFGWRVSMYLIGLICILIGIILINRLRDTPQSIGLPSIEEFNNEIDIKAEKLIDNKIMINILYNKKIWLLSILYFFIYIIRTAINDWTILYLVNQKGYNLFSAGLSIFYFEIGGILGMIVSGWITDKIFNGKRIFFIFICNLGLITMSIILWNIPVGYKNIDYFIITFLGFFTFGPQMLIGLIASEIVEKDRACTANGFVSCWAYLGAAITGYPFSLIINLSWNIYFLVITICTIILMIFIIPVFFE